jgi:hypothetical protein
MEAMGIPDIPDCILMDFTQCLALRWTLLCLKFELLTA